MSARLYRPEDAAGLDALLREPPAHVVDLELDQLIVSVDEQNRPTGILAARPALWLHEFRLAPGNLALQRAGQIAQRAAHSYRLLGYRDVLFFVSADNERMLRRLQDLPYKPVEQPEARIFWVRLPRMTGGFVRP